MEFEKPLDPIWKQYEVTKDCFKVAQRTVERSDESLLVETGFVGSSYKESGAWIRDSREDLDNLIVVSLWAIFERRIISLVQGKGKKILEERPPAFAQKLHIKFIDTVEYWRIEDVLNLFKNGRVDPKLLENAMKIKRFRDWIVHRNPAKASTPKATPETTYHVLSKLMYEIQNLSV